MRGLVVCLLLLSLACSHPKPVVSPPIEIPVATKAVPPPELTAPMVSQLPLFINPALPAASSALDTENERVLRALINDLINRIIAWEAWAYDPATTVQPAK